MNGEFYVGYSPSAPAGLVRRLRIVVLLVFTAGAALCLLLVSGQAPFASSRFEYGTFHEYRGEYIDWPYPLILTASGPLLLVDAGKHGFRPAETIRSGQFVRLEGALIQRATDRMLEVRPGSLMQIRQTSEATANEPFVLGQVNLVGEIVDSKCFLGVMNPGNGKVHRECAVRCISGGIPPAFVARDAGGNQRMMLLTGPDGRRLNREVLDFVGERLRVKGRLLRSRASYILQANPRDFERE